MSDPGTHDSVSTSDKIVKLAIFAVGGQGGGVLNSWIVDLAERNGYDVQATSVAGVAQRTGATIYYVEMLPCSDQRPIFALAPTEGDVDILIAAEMMEAGRAITRGYITPEKTKVIVSTHRQLATVEKIVPGDGTADSGKVQEAVRAHANNVVAFDMQCIAEAEGTVISAALFGALAGSGVLPFSEESYRETVHASGRGVEKSLAAFNTALEISAGKQTPQGIVNTTATAVVASGPASLRSAYAELEARVGELPLPVQETARLGIRKVADFQDLKYASQYVELLEQQVQKDLRANGAVHEFLYSQTAARHLANAMCYDDIIRVADAKTRQARIGRIENEVGATDEQLTQVTEYTHPGAAEIISMMPGALGSWVESQASLVRGIDRVFNRGRRIRTDRLSGFLSFYLLAGMRPWRRRFLRHTREWRHIDAWLQLAGERLATDYHFAAQTLNVRRLIKGYSDTHARGLSKFDQVIEGTRLLENKVDAAAWTKRLIDAALADPQGERLQRQIEKIQAIDTKPNSSIA